MYVTICYEALKKWMYKLKSICEARMCKAWTL